MKYKNMKVCLTVILMVLGFSTLSYALTSPHPLQLYQLGESTLNQYNGEMIYLAHAQKHYIDLILKYPESPLGYLGMSRLHRLNAYLYGNHYNMQRIREEAIPFALKALELGPSLKSVHDNYTILEKILEDYDDYRKHVQDNLYLFPESPQTYYLIANLMRDQNETLKAVDYYHKALELNPSDFLKVKILKRLALLNLNEFSKPEKAIEYCNQALQLGIDTVTLNEYLGLAYLKINQFDLSVKKLTKSIQTMNTELGQYHLLRARGFLELKEGNQSDAIQYLERASLYKKSNSSLHFTLGNLYYERADFANAYRHFRDVIEMEPHVSKAYYFAGRSADSLGEEDLARGYYRKYLMLNSDSQEAAWILQHNPEMHKK